LHLFAACGFPSDTPKVNKLLKSFFSVLLTQLCQSNALCQYFQISPPDFWLVKTGLDVKPHLTQFKTPMFGWSKHLMHRNSRHRLRALPWCRSLPSPGW
jgi:hypothetical protein